MAKNKNVKGITTPIPSDEQWLFRPVVRQELTDEDVEWLNASLGPRTSLRSPRAKAALTKVVRGITKTKSAQRPVADRS